MTQMPTSHLTFVLNDRDQAYWDGYRQKVNARVKGNLGQGGHTFNASGQAICTSPALFVPDLGALQLVSVHVDPYA